MHALVVEDNPDNREIAVLILEHLGYEVMTAETGREALSRCSSQDPRYRLILMDIQMPELDGIEATRRLREDPHMDATIILAVTARVSGHERQRAREAGCDGYLTKPYKRADLIRAIETARLRRLEAQPS